MSLRELLCAGIIKLSDPDEANSFRTLQVSRLLASKMLFFILSVFGKNVCLFSGGVARCICVLAGSWCEDGSGALAASCRPIGGISCSGCWGQIRSGGQVDGISQVGS